LLVLRGYLLLLVLRGYLLLLVLRGYLLLTGPAIVGPATGLLEPVLPVPVLPTGGRPEPGDGRPLLGESGTLGLGRLTPGGWPPVGGRLPVLGVLPVVGRLLVLPPLALIIPLIRPLTTGFSLASVAGSRPWNAASGVPWAASGIPAAVEFADAAGGVVVPSGSGAMPDACSNGAALIREGVMESWRRRRRKKGEGGRCIAGDGLVEMVMV